MKELIGRVFYRFLPVLDIFLTPFVYLAARLLKEVRWLGIQKFPSCKSALLQVGVFPIQNHYYEPQFDFRSAEQLWSKDRTLSGIDWNTTEQLKMIAQFSYSNELIDIQYKKPNTLDFYFNNGSFESGDAEYWYQLIRFIKPKNIIEVGSGNSTLMAMKAIRKNNQQNPYCKCNHICIEPYENPWLEKTGASIIRKKVEDIDPIIFSELEDNDIVFIDSSHIIRPQGDVLYEYLELLPTLNKGVIVHVHDIFSPRNYLKQWLEGDVRFWNEQYLLEAFLSYNCNWKIIGALNYLHHNYYKELKSAAPFLTPDREPGSFYIRRVA